LAVFQLTNEMSAKAAHKFMANLDYIFYVCGHTIYSPSYSFWFKGLKNVSKNLFTL